MPANSSRNKFGGYKPKATSVASSSAHRSSGFADPNNKKASQSRHRVSAWKQVRENEAQPRPTASSQDKIIPGSSNSNTTDVVDQASAVLEYNELIQVGPSRHVTLDFNFPPNLSYIALSINDTCSYGSFFRANI